MQTPALLIGIGNSFRSDDRAGLEVARRIKPSANNHLEVLEMAGNPLSLLDLWNGYDQVLLTDAISSKSTPGTFQIIDAVQQKIPSGLFNTSSHNLGVAEAVEMARSLRQLPKQLWIYGIEGENFEHGNTLSPRVNQAIDEVVKEILSRIQ
jgi:hydrogenase maturation protease